MATNKTGLDYFPMNIDFFEDDKIQLIESEFGIQGTIITVKLLCKIYKEGYFYKFDDDACLLFAKKVGQSITHHLVREVVSGLVKRSFFDKGVFDSFGILTSKGIQIRYFEASQRRRKIEVIKEFLLVDVKKYDNVYILGQNVDIKSDNDYIFPQSKRKESKVEESKRKESESTCARAEIFENLFSFLKKHQKKYFLREHLAWKRAFDDASNGIATELLTQEDPQKVEQLKQKLEKQDEAIFNQFLGIPIRKEIEKCWNYYEKKGFKIDGNKISNWYPVISSWMDRKEQFEKAKK